jgi:hypothetical protein
MARERTWLGLPDGASLHLTNADLDAYVKEYWDGMPKAVPDEYSRPVGSARLIEVDAKTYNAIKKSKHGIRLWQSEYREIRK